MENVRYGMYGKLYICPNCGETAYFTELKDGKCDKCLNPEKYKESLIKKNPLQRVQSKQS